MDPADVSFDPVQPDDALPEPEDVPLQNQDDEYAINMDDGGLDIPDIEYEPTATLDDVEVQGDEVEEENLKLRRSMRLTRKEEKRRLEREKLRTKRYNLRARGQVN